MSDMEATAFKFEEQMKKLKPGFSLERRPNNGIGYLSDDTQYMWQGYLLKLNEDPPEATTGVQRSLRAAYVRCRQHADEQAHLINKQHAMLELYKAMGELSVAMPELSSRPQSLSVITKGVNESLNLMRSAHG